MIDTVIIGCGAAGMMAGITLAEKGLKVVILEKNEKPGKKLFITGKGRCNLTNNCDKDELYKNVVSNPKFLFSSFDNFDSYKTMDFFEKELGLNIKTERGNRVFPVSDHSSDVINVLQRKLNKLGVKIRLNCEVKDIITKQVDISDNSSYDNEKYENKADKYTSYITGIEYKNEDGKIQLLESKNVVVATGGLSYPRTGSTGDGISWARKLELKVTEPVPALVPLVVKEEDICKRLMGLSLKNIKVSFTALVKNKKKEVYSDFGEMLFTHFGVSGPVILSASSYLTRYFDSELKLSIDFKPALSNEQLDSRLLRDFENNINKQFQNSLDELLPKSL
ncbi:MAG: NAD(P)/FAD-dependent oxidoreductase, partial [Lachnospiraceae bacterium]|nr:NAD(P)/FAD-dependent oxidoreductase [Lachnospiraceae bacterium]